MTQPLGQKWSPQFPAPLPYQVTLGQGWQKKIKCDQELQITVLSSNLRGKLVIVQFDLQVVPSVVLLQEPLSHPIQHKPSPEHQAEPLLEMGFLLNSVSKEIRGKLLQ